MWREAAFWGFLVVGLAGCFLIGRDGRPAAPAAVEPPPMHFDSAASSHPEQQADQQQAMDGSLVAPLIYSLDPDAADENAF